jgi:phosphoketolase
MLTINVGSLSLKFALFALADPPERLLSGRVERIGMAGSRLIVAEVDREPEESDVEAPDQAEAVNRLIERLGHLDKLSKIVVVGRRVVLHRLTYRRNNHENLHVRGYKEEGTISTAFDMTVMNDLDRFHLVGDVVDRVPQHGYRAAYAKQAVHDKLIEHRPYITKYGEDMPEIRN